jgi:WD40 repeat protein
LLTLFFFFKKKGTSLFTTPLYEELSSVVPLSASGSWKELLGNGPNDEMVLVGGALGVLKVTDRFVDVFSFYRFLKVFHIGQRKVIFERKDERLEFAIEQLLVPENQPVIVVTRDQNLLRFDASSLQRSQQIVGDLDEVVDAKIFGKLSDKVAVATNSKDIKLWHVVSNDWELLGGHTNTVLALGLSKSEHLLCSGGKDTMVRVWDVSVSPAVALATLEGHTDSVNAVAFGGDSFVVSAGKDRTIKLWKLEMGGTASTVFTCIGQAAEINCLDVSPNEQLIASGGADKRILLWSATKPLSAAPTLGKKLLGTEEKSLQIFV